MREYTFWSSTEALFVLPLIAQAPKTVGRANYFSLNWKCNFWPPSRLKTRNQAFPFSGIVLSGRLSFQSCGCGAFLCFPLPGPIQLSISWHGPQNETSPNQKDLFLLRYESSTLILYKELSSPIFQSCQWVSQSGMRDTLPDLHFAQYIKA